jgi:hypothetical protein
MLLAARGLESDQRWNQLAEERVAPPVAAVSYACTPHPSHGMRKRPGITIPGGSGGLGPAPEAGRAMSPQARPAGSI